LSKGAAAAGSPVKFRLGDATLAFAFSSGGSSLTAGNVLCLDVSPRDWLVCIGIEVSDGLRATVCRENMDAAMVPVAAINPSGGPETSKLWETLRRRPLKDEEAAGRFSTRDEESAFMFVWLGFGDALSRLGKGSVSVPL